MKNTVHGYRIKAATTKARNKLYSHKHQTKASSKIGKMSDVPPLIGKNNFGSLQSNSSEDEQISVSTLRKIVKQEIQLMMEKNLEVMVIHILHTRLGPIIENLIRPIVKEQIESAVRKFLASAQINRENEQHTSEPRRLSLQFRKELSLPILTGREIKGKGCDFIEVALVDDLSGKVVESGPEASAVVKIVALEGNEGEGDNLTTEEFNNNIVGERKDKKSLLVGGVDLKLNKGIGVVQNIKFRNSSTWMKQNLFKLCARAIGTFDGIHIREAKTESFPVKDCRNEYYKKSEIPDLFDKVWRLKNIAKNNDICKRLEKENINTVEEFLCELFKDPDRLKHIAGMKPINWEITVAHARTCTIDKKMSCYADSQKKVVVVFNLVEQVLGVISGCQYILTEKLSDNEKAYARKLAMDALDDWKNVVFFDDEASVLRYFSSLYASVDPRSSQGLEHPSGQSIEASEMIGECNYNELHASSQDGFSSMNSAGGTPSEMHSVPHSCNTFNVRGNQHHMEHDVLSLATEHVPIEMQSDNEKADAYKLAVHALDKGKGAVFFDDEASLFRNVSCSYASIDPTSSRGQEHLRGQDIEASRMIGKCSFNQLNASCPDIFSSMNSMGGIPSEVRSIPQSIHGFNVMDTLHNMDHTILSRALENLDDGLGFDNDTFRLYSSPSVYAYADHTRSPGQGRTAGGRDVEASGMISECSYAFSNASPQDNNLSINSAGGTPSELYPRSHCCVNDFNMMDDQTLIEHPNLSASPETMIWIGHASERIADTRILLGDRPSKAWVTLINVLSLRRVALRSNMVTFERLLAYLIQYALLAVWKKRRVH